MRLIRCLLLALTAFLLSLAPASAAPTPHAVRISGYAFHPAVLTISAGDTVTWTNTDVAPHDVTTTSAPAPIHGPTLAKGQSWSYRFTVPGTYSYICSIHPDMKATVIVRAAPSSTARTMPAPVRYKTLVRSATVAAKPKRHSAHHGAAPAVAPRSPTTYSAPPAVASVASAPSGPAERPLRPLLIVAGLVAAVAIFCLLLLAARAEEQPASR